MLNLLYFLSSYSLFAYNRLKVKLTLISDIRYLSPCHSLAFLPHYIYSYVYHKNGHQQHFLFLVNSGNPDNIDTSFSSNAFKSKFFLPFHSLISLWQVLYLTILLSLPLYSIVAIVNAIYFWLEDKSLFYNLHCGSLVFSIWEY